MPILSARGGLTANAYGWGAASALPPAFESIATATATGSSGVFTFSSIPSTYKHLQIRYIVKNSGAGDNYAMLVRFNSDSTNNYWWYHLYSNSGGSNIQSGGNSTATDNGQISQTIPGSNLSNAFGVGIIDIPNYAGNKLKIAKAFYGGSYNTTSGATVGINSFYWNSTSAISTITLTAYSGNFTTGSQAALYGIKGKA